MNQDLHIVQIQLDGLEHAIRHIPWEYIDDRERDIVIRRLHRMLETVKISAFCTDVVA